MQRVLKTVFLLTVFLVAGFAAFVSAQEGQALAGLSAGSSADYYDTLIGSITGNWQNYGQLFTTLQGQWFWKIFLVIITAVPAVFLLHYLIVGAKHFDHDGEQILLFPFIYPSCPFCCGGQFFSAGYHRADDNLWQLSWWRGFDPYGQICPPGIGDSLCYSGNYHVFHVAQRHAAPGA